MTFWPYIDVSPAFYHWYHNRHQSKMIWFKDGENWNHLYWSPGRCIRKLQVQNIISIYSTKMMYLLIINTESKYIAVITTLVLSFLWKLTCIFLAAAKKLQEHFCPSVHPSVLPSVSLSIHPSVEPFHNVPVFTINKSEVHAKSQDQRTKVKLTEVKTQFNHFRTVTLDCFYIWCTKLGTT